MDDIKYYGILKRINNSYLFRHEIYEKQLLGLLKPDTFWLDIGCGDNAHTYFYGSHCKSSMGIDVIEHGSRYDMPFKVAPITHIPLPDQSVDLVSLHMVVEHLKTLPEDFRDIERVLKPGGKMIILTTNKWSPLIFLPKLLPNRIKQLLINRVFDENDQDIFKTYHRLNSPGKIRQNIGSLHFKKMIMIEQTSLSNPIIFWLFLVPYILTLPTIFQIFRSNILAIYQKED